MYVRVALNIPTEKLFSYSVPSNLEKEALTGKRVIVPFGRRILPGYIIERASTAEVENIKEIQEIPECAPFFSEDDLRFYLWVSRYYLYPFGKTVFEIVPSIKIPQKNKGGTRKKAGSLSGEAKGRCAVAAMDRPLRLTDDQERAVRHILDGLAAKHFSPYLLHGVTGAGKTEVYLQVMEKTKEQGGGSILLVPEISLTPQLLSRIRGRFGEEEIAVIHSKISLRVRYDQWRRIQSGEVKIVIGARSALFAPLKDLRLIIVDEEHDGSYKQDDRLRYNARDMAVVKAKMHGAVAVLGSATPAVQSYFNTLRKKYHYLTLPKRIDDRALPAVNVVDMRAVRDASNKVPILSPVMTEAIRETLAERNQTLLFLNRRGFNTVILCIDCGQVFKCLHCDLVLTYHAVLGVIKCHYCGFQLKAFPRCPLCQGNRITSYGVGTEKLAEEVKNLFPQARVERMDSDTTSRKGEMERILKALAEREIDILVGTQMVTKGHDFPHITLVGVVAADLSLNVPDFRAAERTFQILTQVSGRGGRGKTAGRVVIQTFNPSHYAVRRSQNHDYRGFYEDEIRQRRSLSYPPYTRLVNLHITSMKKDHGRSDVEDMARVVKKLSSLHDIKGGVEILGPVEAPVARLKDSYRWQILLKGKDSKAQGAVIDVLKEEALKLGLTMKVDVDPMNFT